MSPARSPDHQPPFSSEEGDGVPEALLPGDSSSGQHLTHNLPALSGVGAQFPHRPQLSSMYGATRSSFSGALQVSSPIPVEQQKTRMVHEHNPTGITQDERSGQAMATMQNMQGAPSFYTPSYVDAVNTGSPSTSGFFQFSQAGWFASQRAAGMPQTSMAPAATATALPYNGEARASTSRQDRRESPWTDLHTEVLRQGKRAGKSLPDIVIDLYQIDGVERTTNMVSKRWRRMKEGCINKHEMDSILHAVCPEMVRMVYGELSNLDVARMPNFGVQLAAAERRARDILRQHVARGVQEVVLRLFSNDASRSE